MAMTFMSLDDDSDSDTNTLCLLSDSDSEDQQELKRKERKKNVQEGVQWKPSRSASSAGTQKTLASDVIYVKGSDSESEEDCLIVEAGSPRAGSHLLPDFFDRETPPVSPRKLPQKVETRHLPEPLQPKICANESLESVKKNKRVRDIRVKLGRIDEQLLEESDVPWRYEEHSAHGPVFDASVSKTNPATSIEKHTVEMHSSVNQEENIRSSPLKSFPTEMPHKESDVTCQPSSPGTKKIRITLEIPFSKILQIENNKHSRCKTHESTEYSQKSEKRKSSQEIKGVTVSKNQRQKVSEDEQRSNEIRRSSSEEQRAIVSRAYKESREARRHSETSKKRRSSHASGVKFRCEICWLRVANVADHILQEHNRLFI